MEGRGTAGHLSLLGDQDVDLWLLTEVPADLDATDYGLVTVATSEARMQPGKHFAAVLSGVGGSASPAPHFATAAARVAELDVWCSVLPWRTAESPPWTGTGQKGKAADALAALAGHGRPQVWGGDWNQELVGGNPAGSQEGRAAVEALLTEWSMDVPTRAARHRNGGPTIDHVAVRTPLLTPRGCTQIPALGLSDHDAYVVDVDL